jgi:hypothetical protein
VNISENFNDPSGITSSDLFILELKLIWMFRINQKTATIEFEEKDPNTRAEEEDLNQRTV